MSEKAQAADAANVVHIAAPPPSGTLNLGPVAGVPAESLAASDFDKFCQEQAESVAPSAVVWWSPVVLPKSTTLVFSETDLYLAICESCRSMANVAVDASTGRVERTFCDSCRIVLGRHGFNRCQGGTSDCIMHRFVDPVGTVAPLCKGCHHSEHSQRNARRARAKRGAVKKFVKTPVKTSAGCRATSTKILVEQ